MAKAKRAAVTRSKQQPRKWPNKADLKPWLECYLDVCERQPRPDHGALKACTRLKQLAECGDSKGALARLQRMLGKLPASESQATAFLALTGAEICLDLPEVRRAEKFLEQAEERHATAKPLARKAIQAKLKLLRAANGLPASEASGPLNPDSPLAQLGALRHRSRTAYLAGDQKVATRSLQQATQLIPEIDPFWHAQGLTLSAVAAFRQLGGEGAVIKYVAWLDRNGHSDDLPTGGLWGMGLADVANQRSKNLIAGHLKKLKVDSDPNIHFPVDALCKELWFFLQTGQRDVAGTLLQKVLRELPHWPGVRGGFATSGVLTALAEVLAEIDGPEAAKELLGLAVQAGDVEPHRGFRKGALQAAQKQLEAPGLAAAIVKARGMKNAKLRRGALVPLLTRHAAWPELGSLLGEITSAEELLDGVHAVLFQLPGGNRLA